MSLIGERIMLDSAPLEASTWGLSPEAVAAQRRLMEGGGG